MRVAIHKRDRRVRLPDLAHPPERGAEGFDVPGGQVAGRRSAGGGQDDGGDLDGTGDHEERGRMGRDRHGRVWYQEAVGGGKIRL